MTVVEPKSESERSDNKEKGSNVLPNVDFTLSATAFLGLIGYGVGGGGDSEAYLIIHQS